MGLTWWYYDPSLWHSPRTVNSHLNTTLLNEEEAKMALSFWMNWNKADWAYGETTLAFFCAGIGFVALFNLLAFARRRAASRSVSVVDRVAASIRYFVARQYRAPVVGYYFPPLAAVVGVCGMAVFVGGLTFGRTPYYWPNPAMGHAAPLAVRTGWISLGIMPFMIAFAAKVNLVAILTNSSHEKLQVFHRWSAFLMYVTSLIHTFLYIVRDINDPEYLSMEWWTQPFYWTGVAALVPQTILIFLSWSVTRDRYYETFKKLHYVASAVFMIALFFHVNLMLTSWDYFWATLALFLVTWVARGVRTVYNSGLYLPATISLSAPGSTTTDSSAFIEVTIACPAHLKWAPGQHVFVRFLSLGVHALSSHPFTIASLPEPREGADKQVNMVLVFRVYDGATKALHRRLVRSGGESIGMKVWVDGPYGGSSVDLKQYERVVLIAGGSGATFTVPLLKDLVAAAGGNKSEGDSSKKHVTFVLAVRDGDALSWMEEDLNTLQRVPNVSIHIHVTRRSVSETKLNSDTDSEEANMPASLSSGRPDVADIVRSTFRASQGERVGIAVCGPESMVYTVRNAVADCQLAIMDGFSKCPEVFLHTESYSW